MLTPTPRAMMLFTLLSIPQAVMAGSMTYDIVNYPADQNGWTLSGTITTDGKTGDLAPTDILSWTWTITTGGFPFPIAFTASSSDATAGIGATNLEATTTDIEAPIGGELDLQAYPNYLVYNRLPGFQQTYYTEIYTGGRPILYYTWSTINPSMGGTDPWVIASVPEPSSLYLLGFGAVCGSVYVMGHKVMGRKRRERRTATTA